MKLKLGTIILWIHAFAVVIFMVSNYIFASWITGFFGTSVFEANPLWFLELAPYIIWAFDLIIIGGIWQLVPRSGGTQT